MVICILKCHFIYFAGNWSQQYHRIIRRFNNTIRGQFFGHTHYDEFEVMLSPKQTSFQPVNVLYVAPSLTPHNGMNSAYRIYEIDGQYPSQYKID